jgi:signal transduction histidine kinase
MNAELHDHVTTIIACAQGLLGEHDGPLSEKQRQIIKTIIANAEHFIHIYAECLAMPIGDFIAKMRHQVGTPLTPIRGYSELLLMGAMGQLNERQEAQIQAILDSTAQLQYGVDAMVRDARRTGEMAIVRGA